MMFVPTYKFQTHKCKLSIGCSVVWRGASYSTGLLITEFKRGLMHILLLLLLLFIYLFFSIGKIFVSIGTWTWNLPQILAIPLPLEPGLKGGSDAYCNLSFVVDFQDWKIQDVVVFLNYIQVVNGYVSREETLPQEILGWI